MSSATWLVPVRSRVEHQAMTVRALDRVGMTRTVLVRDPHEAVRAEPAPLLAVVQGGGVTAGLVDVLRLLLERDVPSLVFVENLSEHHESLLLGMGAFDVLELPVSPRRLDSRIRAALAKVRPGLSRGRPREAERVLVHGALRVDLDRRLVTASGELVALTRTEYDLVAMMAGDPARTYTREELGGVGGVRSVSPGSIESHLSRARRKLYDAGGVRFIESVRGRGYRLGGAPGRPDGARGVAASDETGSRDPTPAR